MKISFFLKYVHFNKIEKVKFLWPPPIASLNIRGRLYICKRTRKGLHKIMGGNQYSKFCIQIAVRKKFQIK